MPFMHAILAPEALEVRRHAFFAAVVLCVAHCAALVAWWRFLWYALGAFCSDHLGLASLDAARCRVALLRLEESSEARFAWLRAVAAERRESLGLLTAPDITVGDDVTLHATSLHIAAAFHAGPDDALPQNPHRGLDDDDDALPAILHEVLGTEKKRGRRSRFRSLLGDVFRLHRAPLLVLAVAASAPRRRRSSSCGAARARSSTGRAAWEAPWRCRCDSPPPARVRAGARARTPRGSCLVTPPGWRNGIPVVLEPACTPPVVKHSVDWGRSRSSSSPKTSSRPRPPCARARGPGGTCAAASAASRCGCGSGRRFATGGGFGRARGPFVTPSPRRTGLRAAEHRVRCPRVALRRGLPRSSRRRREPTRFFGLTIPSASGIVVVLLRLGQLLGRRGPVERINKNRRDGVVPRLIRSLLLALRPRLGLGAGLAAQDRVGLQERRAPVLRGGRVDVARRLYDGRVQHDALRRRVALDGRHDALVLASDVCDAAPPQTQRDNRVQVDGLAVVDLPRRAGVVAAGGPRVLEAPDGLLHLEGLGLLRRAAQRLRRLVDELLLVADFALALFGHFLLGVPRLLQPLRLRQQGHVLHAALLWRC